MIPKIRVTVRNLGMSIQKKLYYNLHQHFYEGVLPRTYAYIRPRDSYGDLLKI